MDSKDIRNLQEAYLSVYNSEPEYISEEVEIATEYFYEMGLNEHGVDILIEELGEDEFVQWVYDIAEEYTLTEATRLQKTALRKSNKILTGPKGSRPQSTTKAREKSQGGLTMRSSQSPSSTIRKRSVQKAVSQQPETNSTPTETKKGIGGLVGGLISAYKQGMERHRQATQTASKAAKTGIEALNRASDTRLARQARVATKKGFKRQQKAIDTFAPKVGKELGRRAANIPAIRDTYKAGERLGRAWRGEEYEYVLEYLLDEGYVSNIESAEKIAMNMSEQWLESIVEELLDEADIMSVHRKPSKTDKGGMVYMKNPNIIRLQNAAARERQGRQEKEKESKNRENAARYDQALRKGINRATNRSEPQDQYAGYGEIEALSPRADGGAHSGRKRLARRASGR